MIKEIEQGFRDTCRLVLGSEAGGLEELAQWLGMRVPLPYPAKSAVSGKEVWVVPPDIYLKKYFKKSRIVSHEEMEKINKTKFRKKDLEGADLAVMLSKIISPVAYYIGNFRYGKWSNMEKVSGGGEGENAYYSDNAYFAVKNVAYSNYVLYSRHMFGCHNSPYCEFCIHTYNCTKVTNAFEADGCTNCHDIYFCHNCEGLSDCILCFNAKNLKYAVANIEVGKEEYERVKKMLLSDVVAGLKRKKAFPVDIYNLGCFQKSKR